MHVQAGVLTISSSSSNAYFKYKHLLPCLQIKIGKTKQNKQPPHKHKNPIKQKPQTLVGNTKRTELRTSYKGRCRNLQYTTRRFIWQYWGPGNQTVWAMKLGLVQAPHWMKSDVLLETDGCAKGAVLGSSLNTEVWASQASVNLICWVEPDRSVIIESRAWGSHQQKYCRSGNKAQKQGGEG